MIGMLMRQKNTVNILQRKIHLLQALHRFLPRQARIHEKVRPV